MSSSDAAKIVALRQPGLFSRKPAHEFEFLPAALEIMETPASPAGRATMLSIVGLIVVSVAWASIGKVDIIVSAQGRVIPSGKVKEIQPLEIGVVQAIHVQDGQHVEAGDLLVKLDPTTNEAEREKISRDLLRAELDVVRLQGVLDGANLDLLDRVAGANAADVRTAKAQAQAQTAEHQAKLATLDRQLAQKRAELDGTRATVAKLEASLPMIKDRADIRAEGLKTQFGNKIDYLNAQQLFVEQKNELVVQRYKISETNEAIAGLEKSRAEAEGEFRRTNLADLAKAESQVAELRQEAVKIAQKTELQTLRAPVSGTVQQLAVHTIGGVVTPAQTLLVLVPGDAHLEIEAEIPNSEVGFVHQGQPVEIKVETFNFTRYGLLHGTVMNVSRDTVAPAKQQGQSGTQRASDDASDKAQQARQPSYVALVSIAETGVDTEQGRMGLAPGLSVTAEIKTGQRRVISYLLSPLTRYRQEAGRER